MTCNKCYGWGGRSVGGTYWDPPEFLECLACVEQDICPKCDNKTVVWVDDERVAHCTNTECGWHWGDDGEDWEPDYDPHDDLLDLQHENPMEEYD